MHTCLIVSFIFGNCLVPLNVGVLLITHPDVFLLAVFQGLSIKCLISESTFCLWIESVSERICIHIWFAVLYLSYLICFPALSIVENEQSTKVLYNILYAHALYTIFMYTLIPSYLKGHRNNISWGTGTGVCVLSACPLCSDTLRPSSGGSLGFSWCGAAGGWNWIELRECLEGKCFFTFLHKPGPEVLHDREFLLISARRIGFVGWQGQLIVPSCFTWAVSRTPRLIVFLS